MRVIISLFNIDFNNDLIYCNTLDTYIKDCKICVWVLILC